MNRIAIVGMSCRLPGADSPQALWNLVSQGRHAITEVPATRWDKQQFYNANPQQPGMMYTMRGGFLDQIEYFDAGCFGIAPREALHMDPQQRLMLELAWEVFEDAGLPHLQLAGTATGVFLGFGVMEYALTQLRHPELIDAYTNTGYFPSIISNRVSYVFDLHGPSLSLDTACSSSLVAVHLACESLRKRESNLALAGGVSLMVDPTTTVAFCKLSALSPNGRCKTFDAAADGYVRGEGAGLVLLKRLEDAIADGDRIYAVILGEAVNQDGKSNGLTAPNRLAQEQVLQQAYANAACSPGDVQYIEAHGTGTFLGDPIEMQAIGNVMRQGRPKERPLLVGSLKTNIGHLEAAAGIAGLIKLAKAIEQGAIPPHLNFETPNPHIPFEALQTQVVTKLETWPALAEARLAGISSFGFGGTNAHVVLGPPPVAGRVDGHAQLFDSPELLLISARDPEALAALCERYKRFLEEASPGLSWKTICQTAAWRRSHLEFRTSIVAQDRASARKQLEEKRQASGKFHKASSHPRIAFLFTGQGAQFVGMGQELYETESVFRQIIDSCDQQLAATLGHSLREVLFSDPTRTNRLHQTAFTQPAMFALQWALVEQWKSWGVEPQLVLGHSIGELAAAAAAGALAWEAGLNFAARRGALMQALPSTGGMLAIIGSRDQTLQLLHEHRLNLSIAASNGPKHTVVSGAVDQIEKATDCAKAEGLAAIRLNVSQAFHSALMDPILDDLEALAASIPWSPSRLPMLANLTGEVIPPQVTLSAAYFRAHARSEVQFKESVASLLEWQPTLCIEIGPGSTLVDIAKRCADAESTLWAPSMRQGTNSHSTLLTTLGLAYEQGVTLQLANRFGGDRPNIDLPKYPFQRRKYWESLPIASKAEGLTAEGIAMVASSTQTADHPLLGSRLDSPISSYRSIISRDQPEWLVDHRVAGQVVFPGAGYVEMAMSAISAMKAKGASELCSLSQVRFLEPLVVKAGLATELHSTLVGDRFSIACKRTDAERGGDTLAADWRTLCTAQCATELPHANDWTRRIDIEVQLATATREHDAHAFYQKLAQIGLEYGSAFQRVTKLWTSEVEAWGEICLTKQVFAEGNYFSPVALDACFHVVAALLMPVEGSASVNYVPSSIEQIRLERLNSERFFCRVRRSPTHVSSHEVVANIDLFLPDGTQIGEIQQIRFVPSRFDNVTETRKADVISWLTDWSLRQERDAATDKQSAESFILVAEDPHVVEGLQTELLQASCPCQLLAIRDPMLSRATQSKVAALETDKTRLTIVIAVNVAQQPTTDDGMWAMVIEQCEQLQDWLQGMDVRKPARIVLLTRGAFAAGRNQCYVDMVGHTIAGWFRSLRLEFPHWICAHFDLDPALGCEQQWSALVTELRHSSDSLEVAWRDGSTWVRQLSPWQSRPQAASLTADHQVDNRALEIASRGSLDELRLVSRPRKVPEPHEIEIQVRASGLNFRDVLNALDMYPGDAGPLGGECAGIVSAVGNQVTQWHVGDQVAAIAAGSFAEWVTTHGSLAVSKPATLSFAEAAALPIVTATAAIALQHFGRIKPGDRVLIHAAAGGVGLAAVRLALRAGAQVYATAGSPRKQALLRSLGVQHVASSRSLDFATAIAAAAQHQGMEFILNSLSGEFIPKSLSLLAPGGRFVEIGKLGTWSREQVAAAFPLVEYAQFDLADWAARDPEWVGSVLRQAVQTYSQPNDRPWLASFPMERVRDAFRTMSQGRHVGKLVISQPLSSRKSGQALFEQRATYLITGGLGAIGQQLVTWMIRHGARHFDLILHRMVRPEEQATLVRWQQQGAQLRLHTIDPTDIVAVQSVVATIDQGDVALAGVFHLAGVLRDRLAIEAKWSDFRQVLDSKALIAWNLHQALRSHDLKYFVLFSSIAAELGSPGQANYAAANAFLNALAHARHCAGLAGIAIQWGPWAGEGMAKQFSDRGKQSGIRSLQSSRALAELEHWLRTDNYLATVVDLDVERLTKTLGASLPSSVTRSLHQTATQVPPSMGLTKRQLWQERINSATTATRLSCLIEFLESLTIEVLGLPVGTRLDLRQPLRELGLDSLMAVEMRNILSDVMQTSLDTTVLFDHPNIESLAGFLAKLWAKDTLEQSRSEAACSLSENGLSVDEQAARSTEDLADELRRELEWLRLSEGR